MKNKLLPTIAQIACDGEALPQGSPCSPVISELIGQILDLRLLRFAKKHGVRYSRYADDITFSTNQKNFPVALAVQDPTDLAWKLGDDLVQKVELAGFKINMDKTRMHHKDSRQMVTGLVVNKKVNIRSKYYRKTRAMCDSLFQTGKYFYSFTSPSKPDEESKPDLTDNLNPLEGILSHIYAVTQSEERRNLKDQREKPRAIRKLYRRFLFYKYCIALKAPLIITEGKTDPIYLREAIRYRNAYHPHLGKPGSNGFKFAVRFFNYRGQAQEVIGLGGGGTSNLKLIPLDYKKNLSATKGRKPSFKHKPMAYPVILVLDNDTGLTTVISTVKENFGVSIAIESTDDFYHITENLYLIKTPEANGESCIEDLFPGKLKDTRLKGKKFNPKEGKKFNPKEGKKFNPKGGKINHQTEYGKEEFAKSVVKPKARKIDFSGFDPLLDRIVAVLENYTQRKLASERPLDPSGVNK